MWLKLFISLLYLNSAVSHGEKVEGGTVTNPCTNELTAEESDQKFTITPNTQKACSWNINTNTERTLQMYLEIKEENTPCLTATHNEKPITLCPKKTNNTLTAKGPVQVSLALTEQTQVTDTPLLVHYQLVNDDQCSTGPSASPEGEPFFYIIKDTGGNIPSNLQCIWEITTTLGKVVRVSLDVKSPTTEQQCITVSDATGRKEETICGKANGNEFLSTGQGVIVKYGSSVSKETGNNFKVHYKFEEEKKVECSAPPNEATYSLQHFSIVDQGTVIPAGLECQFNITTKNNANVIVELKVTEEATTDQCVVVSNADGSEKKTICRKENENQFTSNGPAAFVKYAGGTSNKTIENFEVYYISGTIRTRFCAVLLMAKILLSVI